MTTHETQRQAEAVENIPAERTFSETCLIDTCPDALNDEPQLAAVLVTISPARPITVFDGDNVLPSLILAFHVLLVVFHIL